MDLSALSWRHYVITLHCFAYLLSLLQDKWILSVCISLCIICIIGLKCINTFTVHVEQYPLTYYLGLHLQKMLYPHDVYYLHCNVKLKKLVPNSAIF